MKKLLFLLLIPFYCFGQIGYNPVSQKTWFKDTIQVSKAIRINVGSSLNGKVLTSDAEGRGTWQTASTIDTTSLSNRIDSVNANAWHITGNASTNPATDFIGTTDAQPLKFGVNSANRGMIDADDNIGFGSNLYGSLTIGTSNVALSTQSLFAITSGTNNVGIAQSAGQTITTGNTNICIGFGSDVSSATGDNAIAIGSAAVAAPDAIALGNGASATTGQFAIADNITEIKALLNTPAIGDVLTAYATTGEAQWAAPFSLDTTSLSNRIDEKLNQTDTASLSNRINTKLNQSDTASLSNRINLKLNIADTASLSARIDLRSLVYISTGTASSSATIDFTGLSNTYTSYLVEFFDVIPATGTNQVLYCRLGTGAGPTYATGASDYAHVYTTGYADFSTATYTSANGADGADDKILVTPGISSTANISQSSGFVQIFNPSQSTSYHAIQGRSMAVQDQANDRLFDLSFSGLYKATTAVTAIRLFMGSGNIASGIFKLYGIL